MIRRNLIKAFALGLCVSLLWAGTAYAQSGGGTSAAYAGTVNVQDEKLYEKQREIDEYLFVDHVNETEKWGFTVVYTGVADNYVEIGITPYSEKNAKVLYDLFGTELVKVVETETATVYQAVAEPVYMGDADSADADAQIMDTGKDTPVSANASDEVLMREEDRENLDEELSIQIESFEGAEPDRILNESDEIYYIMDETAEDAANQEISDNKLTSNQDDMVKRTSDKTDEKEMGLSVPGIASAVAGGVIVLGGAAVVVKKKKKVKNN